MSERFITPASLPSPFEDELIGILIEECMETCIRVSKVKRFGLAEVQPGQPHDNSTRMAHEIGDIFYVVEVMLEYGLIEQADIENGIASKKRQLRRYMQHQPPGGWPPLSSL